MQSKILKGVVLVMGMSLFSCVEKEPKLSPRIMKEVNRSYRKEIRKMKKDLDSLCQVYKEENRQGLIDSLYEIRIKEDANKRVNIE